MLNLVIIVLVKALAQPNFEQANSPRLVAKENFNFKYCLVLLHFRKRVQFVSYFFVSYHYARDCALSGFFRVDVCFLLLSLDIFSVHLCLA